MTVPGVSPLVCASLGGQNGAAVTTKPTSILSFMGSNSSRYWLTGELEMGRTHSRPATGTWSGCRNAVSEFRLGRASGAGRECDRSAFLGEQRSGGGRMDHWCAVLC